MKYIISAIGKTKTQQEDLITSKYLKRIMLKHSNKDKFQNVTIDELEESGASWVEFVEYLKDCGAKLVNPKDLY